ncbi:unnamed protein product [Aphanomyces euteiches]|uniref:FYVE-type domain-containing protein n=1 Tax=Aphanomyces euteiches TaxID=100861 RepID=A0A6G0X8H4_9STRA|nr:hypothetical protein Ae201684_007207 [Aphanomyces euteiches]KAH9100846.1 hypothetical protein Ae201684P_007038 [Aphanomyces euteiches]KAH9139307.1 hypothetical protein AeRB84_016427 [Aphanomyces euteiches]KAH9139429.1 hypothetical protein AeRB84_016307 [Aphanomyces euteiches]
MKLPLPTNFFKCPPLTNEETHRLKQQAYATAMDVVQKSLVQPNESIRWTLQSQDAALKIYRGDDKRDGMDHLRLSVGVAEVVSSIDEVVDLFRNDTTERAKEYVNRFGRGLLDSANLYTIVKPTEGHPNEAVSINWMALKSPLKQLVLERDCCYLEGQYEFEMNGKRGWVRALKSLNLMCCPDLQHTLGLVRMIQVGTGHVFLESDRPGYMRIAYVVHADFRGSAPDWAIDAAIKRRCKSLLDIDTFLRENRLAQGHFLTTDQLVPREARRQCFLCQKKFGMFTSKSNCCKCGEVFCSSCNHAWTVKVCGIPTRIEACSKCALIAPTPTRAILSSDFPTDDVQSLSLHSSHSGSSSIHDVQIYSGQFHHQSSHPSFASSSSSDTARSDPSRKYAPRYPPSAATPSAASTVSSRTGCSDPLPKMDKDFQNEVWVQELIANTSLLAFQEHAAKGMKLSPTQLAPIVRKKLPSNGAAPEDDHEQPSSNPPRRWQY